MSTKVIAEMLHSQRVAACRTDRGSCCVDPGPRASGGWTHPSVGGKASRSAPVQAVKLTAPLQDIANFLLIRGAHAFLGHGWVGCSREYEVPQQINWDYGELVGLCKETAANSGVFEREWTKANVSMDCNSWTPTITLK